MIHGLHLAAELLDVLGELAVLARIVDKSADILLIALAAQSHLGPFIVLLATR